MGSLGQSDGATTAAACSATVFSNNSCIVPNSGNAGEWIYAATIVTGASGSSAPAWPQGPAGTAVSDGGVTWTATLKPNCRGDLFVVELR
jgi:hypothetical protein